MAYGTAKPMTVFEEHGSFSKEHVPLVKRQYPCQVLVQASLGLPNVALVGLQVVKSEERGRSFKTVVEQ